MDFTELLICLMCNSGNCCSAHCNCMSRSAGVGGRSVCVYEHIPGLWTRTRGETLSQNRPECVHAPQTTRQRGTFYTYPAFLLGSDF